MADNPVTPLDSGPAPGASGNPPVPPSQTVIPARSNVPKDAAGRVLFGGNVGRKPSRDGFKPGTPEYVEAKRAADRERKRRQRALEAAATPPPPLPASSSPGVPTQQDPSPAAGASATSFTTPPGNAGFASDSDPAAVPWQAESLKPLFEQLIAAAEEGRVGSFVAKCAEAGLTPKLLKEIESDAHWPKSSKILLCRSLPRLAAKWLNNSGISASYQDEVECVSAVILIVQNDVKLGQRLDTLIAELNKARSDTPAPAKTNV
ncbi:MAG: hypothetical protein KIS67_20240 [Verrucomicrobiae bacterium]|nr:hypothetical protein [Verrucomicrobiae bacterium]